MDNTALTRVLLTTADLIEMDDQRTRSLYGAPVGVPVSMAAHLITQAVNGGEGVATAEWLKRAREQSLTAAQQWAQEQQDIIRHAFDVLFPDGLRGPALTAADVRAAAHRLSAEPDTGSAP
ncbi:hypothetical protein ACFYMW_39145 [Streptomyces sp. NPDC006692]|uniref:hypothetical protein n=1 Tax=unclassified Streptomyces TaxID=2593676 RepID=UPI0036D1642B